MIVLQIEVNIFGDIVAHLRHTIAAGCSYQVVINSRLIEERSSHRNIVSRHCLRNLTPARESQPFLNWIWLWGDGIAIFQRQRFINLTIQQISKFEFVFYYVCKLAPSLSFLICFHTAVRDEQWDSKFSERIVIQIRWDCRQ